MSISHVLYITYDGLLEPLGASQVIPYVLGLARRGYSIEVLSFEKPHDAEQARALADKLAEAGVAWCPLTYHRRPPIVSKAYDILAAAAFVWREAGKDRCSSTRAATCRRSWDCPPNSGAAGFCSTLAVSGSTSG